MFLLQIPYPHVKASATSHDTASSSSCHPRHQAEVSRLPQCRAVMLSLKGSWNLAPKGIPASLSSYRLPVALNGLKTPSRENVSSSHSKTSSD